MKTTFLLLFCWPLAATGQILFPGDANNDGRVDNLDVLALGLNFGKTGPPRALTAQGISWAPKLFLLWSQNLPATPTNAGFSDCDGNGVVDGEDVLALKANYDSLQNGAQPPPLPYRPDTCFSCAKPRLIFTFDRDTATVRDTLRIAVFYEQPPGLPQLLSPLGVAFTLEFNEAIVKDSLTRVFFEPAAGDLLFAAAASDFADARALPPGRVEFGAAGKGFPALSFSRPLGVVQIIIEDMIVRADTFWTDFKFDVLKSVMVNAQGQVMLFNIDVDEVVLYDLITGAPAISEEQPLRCYPSPLQDLLRLESPVPLSRVTVFDARGRIVAEQAAGGQTVLELPTPDWGSGIFLVYAISSDGRRAVRRVLKQR